jgi:hypothetical protein
MNGLSRERIEEMERSDFVGMTGEEIEDARKEYALRVTNDT